MKTGFEDVDLGGYPLLQTAWWDEAFRPEVEWLSDIGDKTEDGKVRYHAKANYCQIFRNESLDRLLSDIEEALESARPPQLMVSQYISFMGGVRYFVPRGRIEHTIRVLRPLIQRRIDHNRLGIPLATPRFEYLTELSVQVVTPR